MPPYPVDKPTGAELRRPPSNELLDQLAGYMRQASKKPDFVISYDVLRFIITNAVLIYDSMDFEADRTERSRLHELKMLIPRLREILTDDADYSEILVALGAPYMLACSPNTKAVNRAVKRHDDLLQALTEIENEIPARRAAKPGPKNADDLWILLVSLVGHWTGHTEARFTSNWHHGEPLTPATRFIHTIVEYIDPSRLPELPQMCRYVVEALNKPGGQENWWRQHLRN